MPCSIQRELDTFFKGYNEQIIGERFVTQSAFSQARAKIKPEAFKELCEDTVEYFYSNVRPQKWHGHRLVAIDGSEVFLPKSEETIEEFGEFQSNCMNKKIVLARMSKAFDVLNNITIDVELVNRSTGELTLAESHMKKLDNGDVLLFDRGYPSFRLFKNAVESGLEFCARVAVANWRIAQELVNSSEKEIIAYINPGADQIRRYKESTTAWEPIKCRFVCIELPTGEKEVLVTSLLDTKNYPYELFGELYHLRWPIEESYKIDKHRVQLENFSGKSKFAIYQDLYAKITLTNIASILSNGVDVEHKKAKTGRKYDYKANMIAAISKVKEAFPILFNCANLEDIITRLVKVISQNIIPIRPDRSFQRNKQKKRRYHRTYLSL